MTLRAELLAEVGPSTHISDLCGRAADELLIREMKIAQLDRQIRGLQVRLWSIGHAAGCETKEDLMAAARDALPRPK